MRMRCCVFAVVAAACGGGSSAPDAAVDARLEGFEAPELTCPGAPGCESTGDGVLKAGAAKRVFTPATFETYTDENGDNEYQMVEPFTDLDGNGKFDGVWLFGGGRAAKGVTTDIEVRAMAFVEGDVSVAIAYIDAIGILSTDFDDIRKDPRVAALGIDHIVLGATHAHETPDTIGLWGPSVAVSGRQPFVIQAMHDAAVEAIVEAFNGAEPATLKIGSTKSINDPSNAASLTDDCNKEIGDPIIMDPTLTIARFVKVSAPTQTIGTLVNWANHPEVARADAELAATITAHYPSYLRTAVEQGVTSAESFYAQAGDLAGLGGVTVFVQGALGGQIGSLHQTHLREPNGDPYTIESDHMEQLLGRNSAARALIALRDTGESTSDLPLSFSTAVYNARMDNTLFHVAVLVGIFGGDGLLKGYDVDAPIDEDNLPWLPIRSTYVQIGPLGIVTAPGELHPELWVGGYDGSWSWGWPLYDANKPNPPRFDEAPAPPYMRDLVMMHEGVRYPVLAGCAEGYIGYIVPAYNYALHPSNPYIKEAEGDHYEEVYSLGPLVEQHVVQPILQLLQYRPGRLRTASASRCCGRSRRCSGASGSRPTRSLAPSASTPRCRRRPTSIRRASTPSSLRSLRAVTIRRSR